MYKSKCNAQSVIVALDASRSFFWISAGFGLITGIAAGLIGVGGGEFRLPFLLYYFKNPKTAAAVNLLVGLLTVVVSALRRFSLHQWSLDEIALTVVLIAASLGGAWAGVHYAHRLPLRLLKGGIVGYLLIVGLWMLFEASVGVEHIFWAPQGMIRLGAGFVMGFVIALASAAFGVAGGEMRIPALLYFLAVPIKEAGTISLVASVPTVAMGALRYHSLGYLSREARLVAAAMGLSSVVGVFLGSALLSGVSRHVLKGCLGAILLLAPLALLGERKKHRGR